MWPLAWRQSLHAHDNFRVDDYPFPIGSLPAVLGDRPKLT
jgi:hypothetical protein